MNEKQILVLQWWHSGRDFYEGKTLLERYGKRKNYASNFKNPKRYQRKVEIEVTKAVGLDFRNMPPLPEKKQEIKAPAIKSVPAKKLKPKTVVKQAPPSPSVQEKTDIPPRVLDKPLNEYPKVIRRLVHEYREAFVGRSMLHNRLKALGESNNPGIMAKRVELLEQINEKTRLIDIFYPHIENYSKTGKVPLEEKIWPQAKKKPHVKVFPNDLNALKKRKKNLQSANTKDRNQLLYQVNRRMDKEKPLPDGPKREKLQLRIARREKEIEALKMKIVKLEG